MPHEFPFLHFFEAAQATSCPAAPPSSAGHPGNPSMWYIFPQLQGVGFSPGSHHYALATAREATAYAHHPVLGRRLVRQGEELLALAGRDATQRLGAPDAVHLRACMTLFASLPGAEPVFQRVLDKFFGAQPDANVLRQLRLPS